MVRRTLLRGIAVAACATGCCAGASPTTARSMANALRGQRTIAAWGGSAWCWIEMDDGTYRVRHSLIRIAPAPIAHAARRHTSRAALACIAVQPPVKRRVHTARRSTSGRVRRPALLSIRRAIAVAPTQRLRHHQTQSLEWRHRSGIPRWMGIEGEGRVVRVWVSLYVSHQAGRGNGGHHRTRSHRSRVCLLPKNPNNLFWSLPPLRCPPCPRRMSRRTTS